MAEKKPSEFYTSTKISPSFKIFIGVFLIVALFLIGYLLYKEGEGLTNIITLMIGVIAGIVLIFWIFAKMKRVRDLTNLSELEKSHVDDLAGMKITAGIKKLIFPDVDIRPVLAFIVIVGDMINKMLFYIFISGLVLLFIYKNNTIFDKAIMLSLALIWSPWIENIIIKRLDYKIIFLLKLALTIIVFSIAIKISP